MNNQIIMIGLNFKTYHLIRKFQYTGSIIYLQFSVILQKTIFYRSVFNYHAGGIDS